jgi:large subunit ribosomal protein L25
MEGENLMELVANKREITGKKVKSLRRNGITPINLVGHNIEPLTLQCETLQLKNVLMHTGTTGLVNLMLDKTKKPRSVMFREIQRAPISGELLHVDLYQVNMNEKLKVEVPVVIVGQAPALKMKENFLAQELTNLFIECLPGQIPNHINIDISSLMEAGQGVHVRDIKLGEGISILNNPDQAIAKISIRFVEKEVPVAAVAAEAVAEGEAPAEGEAKAETAEAKPKAEK